MKSFSILALSGTLRKNTVFWYRLVEALVMSQATSRICFSTWDYRCAYDNQLIGIYSRGVANISVVNNFAALLLGALIGLERQWRTAGLRINSLLALGVSLFGLLTALKLGSLAQQSFLKSAGADH